MMEEDPKYSPALLRALDPATGTPKAPSVRESFARFQTKMNTDQTTKSTNVNMWRYISIAAVLVVAIVGIKYIKPGLFSSTPETRTYTAAPGQNLSFALEDGTRVTLAPGTTLNVTGTNTELNGEAAFTVNHNKSQSFTVTAQGYRIAVLGTHFAVRAYDSDVRVAVAEGKVSVGHAVVVAKEVAFIVNGEIRGMEFASVDHMFAFTKGTLKFNSVALEDAIPDLERWYDVKIVVKDSTLAEEPFTATFAQGSLGDLASILGMTFNAKAVREGRVITLTRN